MPFEYSVMIPCNSIPKKKVQITSDSDDDNGFFENDKKENCYKWMSKVTVLPNAVNLRRK